MNKEISELIEKIDYSVSSLQDYAEGQLYHINEDLNQIRELIQSKDDFQIESKEEDCELKMARKNAVKSAKDFLLNWSVEPFWYHGRKFSTISNVEFYPNKEKGAVTAIIRDATSGGALSVGVAKTHPDDTYNEYIGTAIAFFRALGEEKYGLDDSLYESLINSHQPKEIKEGMVIGIEDTIDILEIFNINSVIKDDYYFATRVSDGSNGWLSIDSYENTKILNDTNVEY